MLRLRSDRAASRGEGGVFGQKRDVGGSKTHRGRENPLGHSNPVKDREVEIEKGSGVNAE